MRSARVRRILRPVRTKSMRYKHDHPRKTSMIPDGSYLKGKLGRTPDVGLTRNGRKKKNIEYC